MRDFVFTLLFSLGFNIVMFIPAFIYKTDRLTDISYSFTFIAVVIFGYSKSDMSVAQTILAFAISLWALRLGTFLFRRILRMKRDKRFDKMRDYFFKFLGFWLIQGVTVPVVMISSIIFFNTQDSKITVLSITGLAVFLIGLLIEATADNQKFNFTGNPENRDKWIESGLWGLSRHPNYLGEMMVWLGVYVYVLPSLSVTHTIVALISPLYIIGLLLFVSGVPLLEKSADNKWGSNPKYQAYKKRTPLLVPFIRLK